MVERGEHLRLALEARQAIGVAGHGLGQHLDGDVALQAGIAGAIHLAHPAFAQFRDDLVCTEVLAHDHMVCAVRINPLRRGYVEIYIGSKIPARCD